MTNKVIKKVLVLLLVVLLTGCSFFGKKKENTTIITNIEDISANDFINIQVGSEILFGQYEQDNIESNGKEDIEWIVLNNIGDECLLISKYVLDCVPFNEELKNTTWNSSYVRKWINTSFYNNAFSEEEKKHIKQSKSDTEYNPIDNTIDKVFLLSVSEAEIYFSSDEERLTSATEYSISKGIERKENNKCWWWLRTVCEDSKYVMNVRTAGNIRYNPETAVNEKGYGIRPVIKLSYNLIEESNNTNTSNSSKIKEGTIEVLDEKISVYSSYEEDREWIKSIYKGETYSFYDTYYDGEHLWYKLGNNQWIKDYLKGSRVKNSNDVTLNKKENIITDVTITDVYDLTWYCIGDNKWVKASEINKYAKKIGDVLDLSNLSYNVFSHLSDGSPVFYILDDTTLTIEGSDNDLVNSYTPWPEEFKSLITTMIISSEIVSIGNNCFKGWNIENLYIDNTSIIENEAFYGCSNLQNVYIRNCISLGANSFYGCPLKQIYYSGNQDSWDKIEEGFNFGWNENHDMIDIGTHVDIVCDYDF